MHSLDVEKRPSKEEQLVAMASYNVLDATLRDLKNCNPVIEIQETGQTIKIPLVALKILNKVLKVMSLGKPLSLVPLATEVTTAVAAELIGCSRPHLVKILERGDIAFTKIGKHRRVKYEDVMLYRMKMKSEQESAIIEMMQGDEELGLYDS